MGCDIEYDPAVEARIAKAEYEREKARNEEERAYGIEVFNALKDLPIARLDQPKLVPFVGGLLERSQAVADVLPQLNGLDINDSLGRDWEVVMHKGDESHRVYGVSFRRMNPGCVEAHNIYSLDSSGVSVHYANWRMPGENIHDNNLWAQVQTAKRFDDLLGPLEKALGLVKRAGEPISDSR